MINGLKSMNNYLFIYDRNRFLRVISIFIYMDETFRSTLNFGKSENERCSCRPVYFTDDGTIIGDAKTKNSRIEFHICSKSDGPSGLLSSRD